MKCKYSIWGLYCCILTVLISCAQKVNNVPDYNFNRQYDMDEIIKTYESIDRPSVNEILEIIKENTLIGFSWIDTPLGQITLFKNDDTLCAIKIISFKKGQDKKAATSFDSGAESFYAEYEMFTKSLKENNGSNNKEVIIKHGKLTKNSTFGIGRLAFGGGNSIIKCGSEKLRWNFPTAIAISNDGNQVKFSPTRIRSFDLVDFYDIENIWYGYEENRKIIYLPKFKR